jgi:hypothetical protein
MILPRGITGFGVPNGHAYADPQIFRADCWEVVAPMGGRAEDRKQVLDVRSTSFLTQVLVFPGSEVTALLNKIHPWVGFCIPLVPGDCRQEFIDARAVAARFEALGRYRVLSGTELDQPVDEAMCAALRGVELHQLKYWGKLLGRGQLRVGDMVFNVWD